MTRQLLRSICRVLIGAVLFAQLAVAAYACPALSRTPPMAMPTVMADGQPMPDCDQMPAAMDPDFANLCAEHCHAGQQSHDQAATLTVPAMLLTALYVTPISTEPVVAPRLAAATTSARAAASPPLAILHCCFRL